MYSLVLMTAMASTPDAAEFNGYFRDLFNRNSGTGCTGASCGGTRYSCYGGCGGSASYPAGCTGSCSGSCSGSKHQGGFLGMGLLTRRTSDSSGCCGGCTGHSFGCTGAMAYSCSGFSCSGMASYSCFGGPAISYTPVFNGGLACYAAMPEAAPPPVFNTFPQTFPQMPGVAPVPGIPYATPEVAPPAIVPERSGLRPATHTSPTAVATGNAAGASRATVIVKLPADARLFADSRALALTGTERKFVSPDLPAGQEFTYRFKVEYERDGETISVTKKVPVKAGGSVTVEFVDLVAGKPAPGPAVPTGRENAGVPATPVSNPVTPPNAPAAETPTPPTPNPISDRATITVKLPPGAVLYVDGRKSPVTGPVAKFTTPPLPAGREFAYLMKAEVIQGGQTTPLTMKVPFQAGHQVDVDFTTTGR